MDAASGSPASHAGSQFKSVGIALLLEVLLIGGGGALLAVTTRAVKSEPAPVVLQLAAPEEKKAPEPPKPKPEPPKPKLPQPKVVPPIPVPPPPPEPPPSRPVVKPVPDLQPVAEPTPFSEPAPPPALPAPPPPPPVVPADVKPDPMLVYAGRVKAAVQAAVVYPAAAQRLRMSGRTRVEFVMRDAQASNPTVIQSSGIGLLDQAALAAVAAAAYPTPPDELVGVTRQYQVWVEFRR